MIKNIILDLDGTLADTASDIITSLKHALKKKNIYKKLNLRIFKGIANKGSVYMVKKFIGSEKKKLIIEINDIFLDHYQKNICIKSKLKKNVLFFLNDCKKKKFKLFVSTNKSEKNARLLLKKLNILKFFKFVAGSDTFFCRKPNPIHLEMLKKKFGFKKKQSIYIGDTEIDANLAKSFKIKFILIKNGYTSISHTNISSDFTVSNFTQISSVLKKLS